MSSCMVVQLVFGCSADFALDVLTPAAHSWFSQYRIWPDFLSLAALNEITHTLSIGNSRRTMWNCHHPAWDTTF